MPPTGQDTRCRSSRCGAAAIHYHGIYCRGPTGEPPADGGRGWNANRFEIAKAKADARQQPFPKWLGSLLEAQREMEEGPDGCIFLAKRSQAKTLYTPSIDDILAERL